MNVNEKDDILKGFLELVRVVVVTVIVTVLILQFVQVSKIYGTSMENTYHEGNIVLVDKVFYKKSSPHYNDVVVVDYQNSGDETFIIKRVIALGGDHIEIKDDQVYRNGQLLKENYIKEAMVNCDDLSIDVPKGQIFVMGDNRNVSLDSRRLGCFSFKKDVIGKVFFKVPFF